MKKKNSTLGNLNQTNGIILEIVFFSQNSSAQCSRPDTVLFLPELVSVEFEFLGGLDNPQASIFE